MDKPAELTQPPVFPVLTTQRLLLREFSLEDAPAVFEIFHREDVNAFTESDPMKSIDEAIERIQGRRNLFYNHMGYRWALTLREAPEKVIGSCGFFSVRRGTQTMETGYELHPKFWGKGMMSEALQAMINFAFGDQGSLPVHRIEALVLPENLASIRVLEKLGFILEGVRHEFGFWKGRYQDVYLFALLNSR